MKEIDRRAIEEWGLNGLVLMENAGRAVVDSITEELGSPAGRRFTVVCGKGNNGGDGFVVARHLANRGAEVTCLLLGKIAELRGDARTNAEILSRSGLAIHEMSDAEALDRTLTPAPVIIDAIFGTGLSSAPRGIFARAIDTINRSGAYIVSIDCPSGVDTDTGQVFAPAITADLTVTMCLPKYGLILYPGKLHTGKLRIADIGIPRHLLSSIADTFLLDLEAVQNLLPRRRPDGHKGTFGTALVIAGSRGYSGALCLALEAALRAGAGLVRAAFPKSLSPIVEARVLEAVKHPLPETPEGTIAYEALPPLLELAAAAESVAIGPGLSTHPETRKLVLEFLARIAEPVVIDADALNSLAGEPALLKRSRAPMVLTPHPGELSRLLGKPTAELNSDRIEVARRFAREFNCVLVLKGAPTVIAEPGGRVFVNSTGNSGLGSGGTGDVLTGLIAGLLAQGATPPDAAQAGVFLHGLAGDLAAETLTEYALAARDLLEFLPRAFKRVLGGE